MIDVIPWTWLIGAGILFLILLLAYQSWLAYKRQGISWTWIRRTVYYLLGALGVAILILRPTIAIEEEKINAILITSVGNEVSLEEYKKNHPKVVVYNDVNSYLATAERTQIDTLHVFGLGISPSLSSLFTQEELVYHRPKFLPGLIDIDIPIIEEERSFRISGVVDTSVVSAQLIVPTGLLENITFNQDITFNHQLEGMAAGRYLYQFVANTSDGDTSVVDLPVIVNPDKKYNALTLLNSPSFEANYFKNYWSELGHTYAQRIQISKNRYAQAFVNRPKINLEQIGTSDLRGMNFIMSDVDSWNKLSTSEIGRIKRKVSNDGATLLLITSGGHVGNDLPAINFAATRKLEFSTSNQSIQLNGIKKTGGNWERIIHGGIDIAYKREFGVGHIGYLPIEDSYKLLLGDMAKVYQRYWTTLLSAFYIDTDVPYIIDRPQYVWEGEMTPMTIHSSSILDKAILHNDTTSISWINNPLIAYNYKVEVNPTPGWNKLSIGEEIPHYFYAYPNESFGALHHRRNVSATSLSKKRKASSGAQLKSIPINHWWGYSLALLGLALVWLEERLLG